MPHSPRLAGLCLLLLAWPLSLHAQEAPDTTQTTPTEDASSMTTAPTDSAARARATESAHATAEDWLSLTDAGAFGQSWDEADSTLQATIGREDWIDQGRRARSRFDSLRSRRLLKTQYRDAAALLPGGRPVVLLQYASTFGGGPVLEAVITTYRDTTWTVAGYRVVPAPSDSTVVPADSLGESASQ